MDALVKLRSEQQLIGFAMTDTTLVHRYCPVAEYAQDALWRGQSWAVLSLKAIHTSM